MAQDIDIWAKWRANAKNQGTDVLSDRYTVLFNECVNALDAVTDLSTADYAHGLIKAYSLVTGDAYTAAWNLINKARLDRSYRAVAEGQAELVP
jgi:hypothetical protein